MKLLLSVTLFAISFSLVLAHDDLDIPTLESQTGNILIDIGYTDFNPVSGDPITFDLQIFEVSKTGRTKTPIEFNEADVSVFKKTKELTSKVIYSSTLSHSQDEPIKLTLTFPEAGEYSINTTFLNNGNSIISDSFDLLIESNSTSRPVKNYIVYALLIFLFAVGLLLFKLKK